MMAYKYLNGNILLLSFAVLLLSSCNRAGEWSAVNTIDITGIGATGIARVDGGFWLSDTDHSRLVKIDETGAVLDSVVDLHRPMHIDVFDGAVYIPDYYTDSIMVLRDGNLSALQMSQVPDAPAGVAADADQFAVADFYNHRIIYTNNGQDLTFGKKGEGNGEFHYPTDVQIFENKLYVADAYNHRGQVFDADGKHLMTFGYGEVMNASTGIFVNQEFIILTDFENDRVITYDHEGKMLSMIDEGLDKPVDVLVYNGQLLVLNYAGKTIKVFE